MSIRAALNVSVLALAVIAAAACSREAPEPMPDAATPNQCACGDGRRCAEGAIYALSCVVCQCIAGQNACQARGCTPETGGEGPPALCEGANPSCPFGECIFDEGCQTPRSYCSRTPCSNTWTQTFCGCDGVSFTTDCPRQPYKHVGPCS